MMGSATGIALAAVLAGALALPAAAAANTYSDAVLASGPLGYFEMDETFGSVALDSSGNRRDGVYSSAGLGADGAFGGSAHGVSLTGESSVDGVIENSSGAIQMWVNPDSNRHQQAFASHGDPRGDGWSVGMGARRKVVFVSGDRVVDSRLSLPSARWTMLSVTWDADRVRFYVNGGATIRAKRMEAAVPASSRADFTVGSSASGVFSEAFQGGVDEVAVFPAALTAETIKAHFAATSLPVSVAAPTVIGESIAGAALTAAPGTYELETSASREYAWQRCNSSGDDCEELSAVGSTYMLTSEDVGHTLQLAETAHNTVGATTVISEPTAVVQAAPVTNPTDGTSSGTEEPSRGTTTDTSDTVSCARLVYRGRSSHALRKRMAGVGRVTLKAPAKSAVRVSSPLRAAVAAKRGKLRKVTFFLDGRKVRIDRTAPYSATIRPQRLAPGRHVLRARIVARSGRATTLTLRLRARAC